MTKEDLNKLTQEIDEISSNFEDKPWSNNVRLLKEDFDIKSINLPGHYLDIISDMEEVLSETRLLYVYSVFTKVCKEEGELYYFDTLFETTISYTAVMKKDENFYLLDSDGHYRETFRSKRFVDFIDGLYWELYEE